MNIFRVLWCEIDSMPRVMHGKLKNVENGWNAYLVDPAFSAVLRWIMLRKKSLVSKTILFPVCRNWNPSRHQLWNSEFACKRLGFSRPFFIIKHLKDKYTAKLVNCGWTSKAPYLRPTFEARFDLDAEIQTLPSFDSLFLESSSF